MLGFSFGVTMKTINSGLFFNLYDYLKKCKVSDKEISVSLGIKNINSLRSEQFIDAKIYIKLLQLFLDVITGQDGAKPEGKLPFGL